MLYTTEIETLKKIVESEQLKSAKEHKQRLNALAARSKDGILRIAVIGEFNAGKSTFINALLRHRLLQEGALPTTASATYLRSGASRLTAVFSDGREVRSVEQASLYLKKKHNVTASDLQSVVSALTATQQIARTVKKLELSIPNQQNGPLSGGLPNNVELIDTPGFNPGASDVDNHFDVTREVVEEYADLAIILTPAHAAMSSTLLSFLENHIRAYLHRCVFVITKIDDHTETERKDLLNMVVQVLGKRFGLQAPRLFMAAARTMLPVKYLPPELETSWHTHQKNFIKIENSIWNLLSNSKEQAIKATLARYLKSITGEISTAIKEKKKQVQQYERATADNMLESVSEVTRRIASQGCSTLKNKWVTYKNAINNRKNQLYNEAHQEIRRIISAGGYLENFSTDQAPKIQKVLERKINTLKEFTNRQLKGLNDDYKIIMAGFEKEFKAHYKDLRTLMPKVGSHVSAGNVDCNFASHEANLVIQQCELSDGEGAAALGAGAVIGQIIIPIPVIGMAIGAFVGYCLGSFLKKFAGPSAEKVQADVLEKVKKEIQQTFNNAHQALQQLLARDSAQKESNLNRVADKHINEYGKAVEAVRSKGQALLKSYRSQINHMTDSLQVLNQLEINFKNTI